MDDLYYLNEAVGESRKCTPDMNSYCVGALIVTRDGMVYRGYTHESGPSNHAEEEAITKALAAGASLRGAVIYSSMEPCSSRKSKPESCSELIVRHGFSRAVFALHEPPCFVACHGEELLRRGGVEVAVIPELGPEVVRINRHVCGAAGNETPGK